ncbi:hypothetical protein LWI29_017781 [Acer saccharum]|uniref:Isoamylase 1-3-like C-terminal domain-containing protein n=1 Tax=Acer saccharum TaxID=4024 RepID=A0AA39S4B9_ACESA|nr:hypothetical protein LWI29_017781 [Acer saccharum]
MGYWWGLYQVGMFPHWGIWSEWNGKYRDVVRQFIKDTYGFSGAFAECLCGSPDYTSECESLGLKDFPTAERLQWHGHTPDKPGRSDTSRFVAYTLIDAVKREIYMAFNAGHLPVTISLPERPGYRWEPLVDNSKPAPYDFLSGDLLDRETSIKQHAQFLDANLYPILMIAVNGGDLVTRLPGYDGDLPFTLETGYVGVGESEEVQLFYYFVESQNDPLQDPLVLWIPGGPSCSAFGSLFFASGPLAFDIREYDGGLPSLVLNPFAWTQGMNIIYLDAPVGTGFSYSKTNEGYDIGDYKYLEHTYHFLVKWFMEHPKFLGNEFYIAGEGFSGNIIPMLAQEIIKGNQVKDLPVLNLRSLMEHSNFLGNQLYIAGEVFSGNIAPMLVQEIMKGNQVKDLPVINLKGFFIGGPGADNQIDFNSRIPFAHRMSFIPDELYETAKTNCNDDFVTTNQNELCASDMDSINKLISNIYTVHVFEQSCTLPNLTDENMAQEYLKDKFISGFFGSQNNGTQLWCRRYNEVFSYIWANDKAVQEALHVHEGSISSWQYCNDTLHNSYNHEVTSVVEYYRNFSEAAKLRVLLYSGDCDMDIPLIGTQQWIMSLNLTLNESWRVWSVDEDQVAGYTTKFTKNTNFNLTYATVKGAGHYVGEYRKMETSAMIRSWIANYTL